MRPAPDSATCGHGRGFSFNSMHSTFLDASSGQPESAIVAPATRMDGLFVCKAFADLTVHELQAIHMLRQQVFVVEQNCVYCDADELDAVSWHLFALDGQGRALATCRLIPAGWRYVESAIGRVVTTPAVRGTGMGRAVMLHALQELAQRSCGPVRISAQQRLQRFYESLGFAVASNPYLEDDIAHIEMLRT